MTAHIHRRFLVIAERVAPPLKAALIRVGRIAPPEPRRRSLAYFLARAVVGQQLSTTAARSIWARIEAAARASGDGIPGFFVPRHARQLRACGLSRAKVRTLIAIREAHESGRLSAQRLRRMNHAERSAALCTIWGIGQWTADMAGIFYFRDPDVWPVGDIGVQRGLEIALGRCSARTMRRVAAAFAPYRSFLALYMWRLLDGAPVRPDRADSRRPV